MGTDEVPLGHGVGGSAASSEQQGQASAPLRVLLLVMRCHQLPNWEPQPGPYREPPPGALLGRSALPEWPGVAGTPGGTWGS